MNSTVAPSRWAAIRANPRTHRASQAQPQSDGIDTSSLENCHPQEIMEDSVNQLTEPVFPRESKLFLSGETHRALLPPAHKHCLSPKHRNITHSLKV